MTTDRRTPGSGGSTIAVIGAGYVGLTTALCLAHFGHVVRCSDIDEHKIGLLAGGEPTILDDGAQELLGEGLASGRLSFVVGSAEAVADAGFVFLCVPTPERPDGSADVAAIESVCREVAALLSPGAVVVNKSTVPIGSAALVERLIGRADVSVLSNPEFLREGSAVADSLHPSRIVIGGDDRSAAERVIGLFGDLDAPVIITNAATAEMIKYASNAFLATKLSFINATANVCEALGADIEDLLRGLGFDSRIGVEYLSPGPGWGGPCLPKDTKALAFMANEAGVPFSLLEEAIRSNRAQFESIVDKVRSALGGSVSGRLVGAWGLTFKAGTDDRRNSPAVEILGRLVAEGATVTAYDPTAGGQQIAELDGVQVVTDPYSAVRGAEVVVVLTEWEELATVDLDKVAALMAERHIVDARNQLDPLLAEAAGFDYVGVGRS